MGGNSDDFCKFLMYGRQIRNHFLWRKNLLFGQKFLIFIRVDPNKWCQGCLRAPKCKKKTFISSNYFSGTK